MRSILMRSATILTTFGFRSVVARVESFGDDSGGGPVKRIDVAEFLVEVDSDIAFHFL